MLERGEKLEKSVQESEKLASKAEEYSRAISELTKKTTKKWF